MNNKRTLLIVDDEKPTRDGLRAGLEDRYDVYVAEDSESAMSMLTKEPVDAVITDFRMPNEDGMKLIKRMKGLSHPPVCILMTAYGSEDLAVQAVKQGADDYIPKGRLQINEVDMRIMKALKARDLEAENQQLRRDLQPNLGLEKIIGQSAVMKEVFDTVKQIASSKTTVLILGESGTGKELIAKAIHYLSPRNQHPLITVHCAALPPNLLESELFGHERGAFTGAHERRIGRFEQAQGGSVFLDEIGEIDMNIQVKLLRFLGERTFERVGSNKTLMADVRIITATNRDLAAEVRKGAFREDLFYRLNVVPIKMPPLRDRRDDIPLLAHAFLKEFAKENDKPVVDFNVDAVEALIKYSWPGNVRELRSAVERAVLLARGDRITVRELPESIRLMEPPVTAPAGEIISPVGSGMTLKEAEKQLIIRALQECNGNRTKAAQKLGMSRRTLHRKLHLYQLENL